jgi:hypothetical protein
METQNRNEILSYILNKIDEDKTGTYRSLARVTFPNTNLLGFSAMVTIEGRSVKVWVFDLRLERRRDRGEEGCSQTGVILYVVVFAKF